MKRRAGIADDRPVRCLGVCEGCGHVLRKDGPSDPLVKCVFGTWWLSEGEYSGERVPFVCPRTEAHRTMGILREL